MALFSGSDDDGLSHLQESGDEDLNSVPVDTDEDGWPDFRDLDSDNDWIDDEDDPCPVGLDGSEGCMEPTGGTEPMAGMEPMAGIEPMAGMETMAGMEPMAGMETMAGMEPMAGMDESKAGADNHNTDGSQANPVPSGCHSSNDKGSLLLLIGLFMSLVFRRRSTYFF